MNKQAPSFLQITTIAGFVLSCFGLLLFLWVAFGGPTPFGATGYTIKVPMPQINQLAEQSDVRISGVPVGKVVGIDLGEGDYEDRAMVTLELEPEYAPVPKGTRAILRQKTLLGETYIELTPGDEGGRDVSRSRDILEDGSTLPQAQVADSVELDEIFRTFDRRTREAFKSGALDTSVALAGRGANLNQTLGLFPPTFSEINELLTVLDRQEEDVSKLIRNTGVVFNALSERQGQLSGLIRNSNTVWQTTAERNQELADFFRIFPTFLRESRATLVRTRQLADVGTPVMRQLVPVARQLSPTLEASERLAPNTLAFYRGARPIIERAPRAFPSLRAFLSEDLTPFLNRVPNFFAEFNPFLEGLRYYRTEVASFIANLAASTNGQTPYGQSGLETKKYLRAGITLGPSTLTAVPNRLTTNRANAYVLPGGYLNVATGMESFETAQCDGGLNAFIPDWSALTPVQQAQFQVNLRYYDAEESEALYTRIKQWTVLDQDQTNNLPAPGCTQQGPFPPLGDSSQPPTRYQHIFRQPTP